MSSKIVLAIGFTCPLSSNLAQYAPDSVNVWPQGNSAFVGMNIVNEMKSIVDVSNIDKDSIKAQFDNYREIVESLAGEGKWKSKDDRHDWFELFNSGEPQIVALAV